METPQVYSDDLNSQQKQDSKLVIIFFEGTCLCVCVCVRAGVLDKWKRCVVGLSRSEAWGQDSRGKLNQGCEAARTGFVLVNLK